MEDMKEDEEYSKNVFALSYEYLLPSPQSRLIYVHYCVATSMRAATQAKTRQGEQRGRTLTNPQVLPIYSQHPYIISYKTICRHCPAFSASIVNRHNCYLEIAKFGLMDTTKYILGRLFNNKDQCFICST